MRGRIHVLSHHSFRKIEVAKLRLIFDMAASAVTSTSGCRYENNIPYPLQNTGCDQLFFSLITACNRGSCPAADVSALLVLVLYMDIERRHLIHQPFVQRFRLLFLQGALLDA